MGEECQRQDRVLRPGDDPEGALEEWYRVKDALLRGRPRLLKRQDIVAVADICDDFVSDRKRKVDSGAMR